MDWNRDQGSSYVRPCQGGRAARRNEDYSVGKAFPRHGGMGPSHAAKSPSGDADIHAAHQQNVNFES